MRNYCKENGLFALNVLGAYSRNSSIKIKSKSYLNVGVPENQRNLQAGNFSTIPKTLKNHEARLN